MKLTLAALGIALVVSPVQGVVEAAGKTPAAQAAPSIPYERHVLDNGLEVLFHQDHRLPLVGTNLWYHVGAANERPGRSGFAHLFEHMMFQGSAHVGDDQHFAIVEAIGGRGLNASTSWDFTNYFQAAPSNQLETLLWLEADRMGFLLDTLDQRKLDNQRDVVRNERRQTTENRPYGMADERMYQLLFPAPHPYHGVVIGSHEDLQAATTGDVKDFFRTYYAPSDATLVVAGDFDKERALALVQKYFGSLPKAPEPPPVTAPVQKPPVREIREAMTDDVQLGRVSFAWVTVPAYSPGEADLQLAAEVLGGGKSSVLYKQLVYDRKLAQSVSCWFDSMKLGSVFACDLVAKPGVALPELEKVFDAALARLRTRGPDAADLGRARTAHRSGFLHGLERLLSRANLLNEYRHFTGDPGYLAKDLARYDAVTVGTMKQAADQWLDPARRVVVTVTPEKEAAR